ncbi:MAG: polysaccharide pyruvyl transferase family protein [Anaerolineales bacterium]|nr:polysaccharide pyruvyl transferase family protein [Anaerolineales bacterium]
MAGQENASAAQEFNAWILSVFDLWNRMGVTMENGKKVFISGYFGRGNTGDEILLSGMLYSLREIKPDLQFYVTSGDPAETEVYHNVKAVPFWDMPAIADAVMGSSLVIVGGGGLFQDYWGVDLSSYLTMRAGGITEYGTPLLLAAAAGIPSMLYSVGVGPLQTQQGIHEMQRLAGLVDVLAVRDEQSRLLLGALGYDHSRIMVDPDPAFFYKERREKPNLGEDLSRPVLGVSLRSWDLSITQEKWQAAVASALDTFLIETDGTVVFVPFQENGIELENDRLACTAVQQRMQAGDRCRQISVLSDPFSRFACLQQCEIVLGMRMHAVLAALSASVPVVGLAYDEKVTALLSQAGLENYAVPLEQTGPDCLAENLLRAWNKRDRLVPAMRGWNEHIQQQGSWSARKAIQLLQSQSSIKEDSGFCRGLLLQQIYTSASLERERIQLDLAMEQKTRELEDIKGVVAELEHLFMHENASLTKQVQQLMEAHRTVSRQTVELQDDLVLAVEQAEKAKTALQQVQESRGFRILAWFWRMLWVLRRPRSLIWILRPKIRSWRMKVGGVMQRYFGCGLQRLLLASPVWFRQLNLLRSKSLQQSVYSDVVLYTDSEEIFPGYTNRRKLTLPLENKVRVSWITTVKNEDSNARQWLQQLEQQTRLPDEILVLDGGSTDGTLQILQSYAAGSTLPLRVISCPGKNIATRRNIGVQVSLYPVIAMTDFGCTLEPDWLEKILVPFEDDAEMQVAAGWYRAEARSWLGRSFRYELIPRWSDISPDTFLPACRSIAFRREVWEQVGGFPEWLTKTGEDTWFGLQLKKAADRWAFVADAVVVWHAPETLSGIWKKLFSWSIGDGESGAFTHRYTALVFPMFFDILLIVAAIGSTLIWPALIGFYGLLLGSMLFRAVKTAGQEECKPVWIWKRLGAWARVFGFLKGFLNRPAALARRSTDLEGVVFLLSGVPFDDTGGGARGTQIALEYLERNYFVVFLHQFSKQESVDLHLDTDFPFLLQMPFSQFDTDVFRREYRYLLKEKQTLVWIEFPLEAFHRLGSRLQQEGAMVVYDLIDDWQTSLGGDWYSEDIESDIAASVDVLVASAARLQQRLQDQMGRRVMLLPNACNDRLFDHNREYERPADLPEANRVLIYIGALWGEWFDWDLLRAVAEHNPGDAVVMIGDYVGQCEPHPDNLHFLGLKPQTALPAYLAHADVGLLPWKVGPITKATSPLKVYEYLAMGVPVLAPELGPLQGLPFVHCARDSEDFLWLIETVACTRPDGEVLEAFLRNNSWWARINRVQSLLQQETVRGEKITEGSLLQPEVQAAGKQSMLSL